MISSLHPNAPSDKVGMRRFQEFIIDACEEAFVLEHAHLRALLIKLEEMKDISMSLRITDIGWYDEDTFNFAVPGINNPSWRRYVDVVHSTTNHLISIVTSVEFTYRFTSHPQRIRITLTDVHWDYVQCTVALEVTDGGYATIKKLFISNNIHKTPLVKKSNVFNRTGRSVLRYLKRISE